MSSKESVVKRYVPVFTIFVFSWSCYWDSDSRLQRFENVAIVVVDTLRSDHLPSYGYERETAPFLSQLAAEGIQLQGTSASSWTKPSVATMLSGLHPQRHQANTPADKLPLETPFLPEILQSNGYSTAAYTANTLIGNDFQFSRGYAEFVDVVPTTWFIDFERYANPLDPAKPPASFATDVAVHLSQRLEPPYYFYVHYLDPHDPYFPKRPWGSHEGADADFVQPRDFSDFATDVDDSHIQKMRDQYDAIVLEVDGEIKRLLTALNDRGLLEETLIVITSDHGEEFFEHGNLTHGKTLHEEVLRVPLIFWSAAGFPKTYRSTERFHHVDLLPTLLEALAIEIPSGLDGETRWHDLITGQYEERSEFFYYLDFDVFAALAVVAPPFKLIHQNLLERTGLHKPTNLLYHLDEDPNERHNRTELEKERQELLSRLIQRHNELWEKRQRVTPAELDERTLQQLAALGYIRLNSPQEDLGKRNITSTLRNYDNRVFGLFGHERNQDFKSRIEFQSTPFQLLSGWYSSYPEGAWSKRRASVVLERPPGASSLKLKGETQHQRGRIQCTITLDDHEQEQREAEAGAFEWSVSLPRKRRDDGLIYVDLIIKLPTAEPGPGQDLGLFWQEMSIH